MSGAPFFQLHVNDRPAGFLRHGWNDAADDAVRSCYAKRHSARVIETKPGAEVRRVMVPLDRLQRELEMPKVKLQTKRYTFETILLAVALAFVAYVVLTGKAKADGFAISGPHGAAIFTPLGPGASPHIIQVPPDLSMDAETRASKWESFCQPKAVADHYGVERLRYAHAGCEFGRDH